MIRYFCMEQCRQFRYIALELCSATLQDLIEGRYTNPGLDLTLVFRYNESIDILLNDQANIYYDYPILLELT